MKTQQQLQSFEEAYITAALWSSTDDDGEPLDAEYDIGDIAPEALASMRSDCADFEQANSALLEQWYETAGESSERAGHDFWLTRNRHGAGFWDRWNGATPQGKIGAQLTEAAHAYGECNLYVGDDGKVWS